MMRRPFSLSRIQGLQAPIRGLTVDEARERGERYGLNDILEVAHNQWWNLARETARDPMIWFLVGIGTLYGLLGDRVEAATLFAALVPLIGMDAFLHWRTQASTQGLRHRLATRATVVRDAVLVEIAPTEVVPGDLAIVSAGEAFPADGLLVTGADLQVDESALTGEAYPVRKHALAAIPGDSPEPVVEGDHWGLAGTRLLTGQARLRVTHTGGETVYGAIVRSAAGGARGRTPLQEAMARLVAVLLVAATVMCVILAAVRARQGHGVLDAFVSSATLAVAALPEEFPVVFAFFLGVGVYRLAQRQALVRRGVSVENIGRVTAICSDKTGTITEGRLQLTHLVPAENVGHEQLLALAAIASRRESDDPLDLAIIEAVESTARPRDQHECLATYPFTEDRKRETAIVRDPGGTVIAVSKGAAEVLLAMSALPTAEREYWNRSVGELAQDGHKVIACAWRAVDAAHDEPDDNYRFAGLLALEDPVREGVAEAINACRAAGIHAVMVTGDHPLTARAVAREIGLGAGEPTVISGSELDDRLSGKHAASLADIDVVARAVPAQKLALVRALQTHGQIVAVTGDGVNDVPALKEADVGIAMGERGTRSAREVAAIVLLDDNFRTIVRAIEEGRQLFRNLRLSFQYLLMIHVPLVLTAALIPLAGYPLLYLPIHIVWIEVIIHPTALLVFQDLPASGVLRQADAGRRVRFFSRREWLVIAGVGMSLTVLIFTGYIRSLGTGSDVEHARAAALVALTTASAFLAAALSGLRTWVARTVAAGTVALSIVLVQTTTLAGRLHLAPLHVDDLGIAVAGSFVTVFAPLALFWLVSGRVGRKNALFQSPSLGLRTRVP